MRRAHGVELERRADTLDMSLRQKFERVGERVIPRRKNLTILGAGHEADVIECDLALVDQAEGRLCLVFAAMKESKELLLRIPVTTEIIYELKSFLLNLIC